ncbi:putative glyoxylate reductase [Oenococcus oeni]|uniref:2-hydroxyacid dehydrogenase family protein n=1 Tax=Oenococcus oeni TaxID=1247 RepID=UPI00107D8C5D|nr:2-hydroxyacid dehydrogenase family protein [Oenococcus oeni]AVI93369.1 hydroxyacid dehydrogenase [Oenococcus oeni]SYV98487.1 putative glyoxylate reductase [Oenococcus oeni]SYW04017.1 putative glyoxylate reductase [Oenococcus oeni]SYW18948.1 putative glyoxylate reductase [Oenococcus oeni]VDC13750.1 putative glyoxylate reductase [Oenococcus oeni]
MKNVLITAELPQVANSILQQAGLNVEIFTGDKLITKKELLDKIKDKDFLITSLSTDVDEDVINAAPKLKLIANFGAGFNNIDINSARAKEISVTNTPFVSTTSVAEVAAGLIISLSHRLVEGDNLMHDQGFNGWSPLFFLGHELSKKTLGIIGMGQIGKALAKRMQAFDMKIVYTQRHHLKEDEEKELHAVFLEKDELIKQSDVISLHLPLTKNTHHLLGAKEFATMKKTSFLINAARGPLIDENALLKSLKEKQLAGAALDVYEHEPKVDDQFKQMKNVILTLHIGNATIEARNAMAGVVAKNVVSVLNGEKPKYIVN